MAFKKKTRWLRWINILILIYLVIGFDLYFLQDKLIFHPEKISATTFENLPYPHHEINVSFDSTTKINIVQFTVPDSICKGVVIYFHGNARNIIRYAHCVPDFTKNKYEVWMVDYPGYGKSVGKLTEESMYDCAEQLYRLARTKFSADSIVIYGRSIGTGIAAWLASKHSCKRVLLETPYYSMTSLASHYFPIYPVSTIIKYKLPTFSYVQLVNAPVTIFHGTNDEVIPYSNSEKLKEVLRAKDEFVTIPGGKHNNLSESSLYHQKLDSLLAK